MKSHGNFHIFPFPINIQQQKYWRNCITYQVINRECHFDFQLFDMEKANLNKQNKKKIKGEGNKTNI